MGQGFGLGCQPRVFPMSGRFAEVNGFQWVTMAASRSSPATRYCWRTQGVENFALEPYPGREAQPVVYPAPHPSLLDVVFGQRIVAGAAGRLRPWAGRTAPRADARFRCFVSACFISPLSVHPGCAALSVRGPPIAHSAGVIPLSVRSCPYRNRPDSRRRDRRSIWIPRPWMPCWPSGRRVKAATKTSLPNSTRLLRQLHVIRGGSQPSGQRPSPPGQTPTPAAATRTYPPAASNARRPAPLPRELILLTQA